MPDRFANWGQPPDESPGDARYRTGDDDPAGGGNFVVAERLDSNGNSVDVLLEWDETNGTWQSRGPVELNGNDLTGVGALDAQSVSTAELVLDGPRYIIQKAPAYDVDTDSGTNLSLSLSGWESSVLEAKLYVITDGNGPDSTETVSITVNQISDAKYDQNTVNSGSVSRQTLLNAWQTEVFGSAGETSILNITASGTDELSVSEISGGGDNRDTILSGHIPNGAPLNSIEISTSYNDSGRAFILTTVDTE